MLFFFFNDSATTEIYTLSLHDALPISPQRQKLKFLPLRRYNLTLNLLSRRSGDRKSGSAGMPRPISYAVFCLKKKNRKDYRVCCETLPELRFHVRRDLASRQHVRVVCQ